MKPIVATIAATAGTVAVIGGAFFAGMAVAHGRVVTHDVRVTRTVTSPPRVEIRYRTRRVTGVPCLESQGRVYFSGGAGGNPVKTTCTFTPVPPDASGMLAVKAADGTSGGDYAPVQPAAVSPSLPAGVTAGPTPGTYVVNCNVTQCTSLPGAGPFGTTCGPISTGNQVCSP